MNNAPAFSTVDYEVMSGLACVQLNRPDNLNAVVPRLVNDLCDALQKAIDDNVSALVLGGRGRAFCAGFDLKADRSARTHDEHVAELERVHDVTRLIRRARFPVVSAVHGYALGNGCEFAIAADLVVASESAIFGFPEVSWGLGITGGITSLLPMVVGLHRAKSLVFLGEHFTAQQAFELGLVHQVVPDGEHLTAALALAERLAAQPRAALERAKRALDAPYLTALDAAYRLEIEHALEAGQSPEAAELRAQYGDR
jgi:enoyl-CoA hydratase/carnithine racemase